MVGLAFVFFEAESATNGPDHEWLYKESAMPDNGPELKTQTHADVPEEVRLKNGITPCTLRVSVGIEDIEDLLAELAEVFKGLE